MPDRELTRQKYRLTDLPRLWSCSHFGACRAHEPTAYRPNLFGLQHRLSPFTRRVLAFPVWSLLAVAFSAGGDGGGRPPHAMAGPSAKSTDTEPSGKCGVGRLSSAPYPLNRSTRASRAEISYC